MIIHGVVSSDGKRIVLETGARLTFAAADCESPLKPGDRVAVDTLASPSIKSLKSGAYSPVTETKVSGASEFKALLERAGDEL